MRAWQQLSSIVMIQLYLYFSSFVKKALRCRLQLPYIPVWFSRTVYNKAHGKLCHVLVAAIVAAVAAAVLLLFYMLQ